jgi:hypothetical protein
MSAAAGHAALKRASKELQAGWRRVAASWRDENARRFEEHHLRPLLRKLREAEMATKQMETMLGKIRRDCEDRG